MANFGERPGSPYSDGRERPAYNPKRPFWFSTANYYVLAVAFAIAFFFLIWGILHDIGEDTPWVTAGISSSIVLCGAVILREIVLRRMRSKLLRQQQSMRMRLHVDSVRTDRHNPNKLTIERNAAILGEIKQKSEAANVLGKLSAAHREVFELCREYMARNENELRTVSAGSPRLAPLLKGRSSVAEFHRYHLLRWAEIEARTLTTEARSRANTDEKVEAAQNALNVIELALQSYPSESSLLESQNLLRELVVSIKVSHWVEEAERAAFKGNYAEARSLYRDALFYLGRDNSQSADREQAARRINEEIENYASGKIKSELGLLPASLVSFKFKVICKMISQRCPRCNSDRIRRGYRPTSIFLKVLFRYNLLCDKCNWEFKGFAVPGTVEFGSNKKKRRPKPVDNDK